MAELPNSCTDLGTTSISDESLAAIESLTGLRELTLRETKITDAVAGWIATHSELTQLRVDNTNLTGAAFSELKKLRRLRRLDAGEIAMTDSGLQELAGHPSLMMLA